MDFHCTDESIHSHVKSGNAISTKKFSDVTVEDPVFVPTVGILAPQPRLGTEVLRGSFLVKESVLGSEVCFKLSAVAVLVDRFLVKAPCFLWTW